MLVSGGMGFPVLAASKAEASRMRSVADDVDRLLSGLLPTAASVATAPEMECWTVSGHRLPALKGIALNHPDAGAQIAMRKTSATVVVTKELDWARGPDEFYRLGPIETGEHYPWNEPSPRITEWR